MQKSVEPSRILVKMLERLRAGLLNGPGLNCRPQNSRQRIDLCQLDRLSEESSAQLLRQLLAGADSASLPLKLASAPPEPRNPPESNGGATRPLNRNKPKGDPKEPYYQQQSLLRKLRVLVEDAKIHEQDTGVDSLQIGFPLLHLAKGSGTVASGSRRILAPVAFLPVTLNIKSGTRPVLELVCRAEKSERVVPNPSLFAWLEQMGFQAPPELLEDDGNRDSWEEIGALVGWLCESLQLPLPELFAKPDKRHFEDLPLAVAAVGDGAPNAVLSAAVLGLFPVNNQALIRDMEAMVAGESLEGPVKNFVQVGLSLDAPQQVFPAQDEAFPPLDSAETLSAANERLISRADPCQARAVRLAREATGLVVHGPPGTGKSQTITNMIGDHLLRGQRVLLVSDKRTALDVVADRLQHQGLGELVAVVHDAGRDQRHLYRSLREQLENLADVRTNSKADAELKRIDRQLDAMSGELEQARQALHAPIATADSYSFHDLVGKWLEIRLGSEAQQVLSRSVGGASFKRADFERHAHDLHDVFSKADAVDFSESAWARSAGITLTDYLSRPAQEMKSALERCANLGSQVDETAAYEIHPLEADVELNLQVAAREELADRLDAVLANADAAIIELWRGATPEARAYAVHRMEQFAEVEAEFRSTPLEVELVYLWGPLLPPPDVLARQIDTLSRYLDASDFKARLLAIPWWWKSGRLLHEYGMPGGRAAAKRLRTFLKGCQARRMLISLDESLRGLPARTVEINSDDDRPLLKALDSHHRMLSLLDSVQNNSLLRALEADVRRSLEDAPFAEGALRRLRLAGARATGIARLDTELRGARLFRNAWLSKVREQLCLGKKSEKLLRELSDEFEDCETVVRINELLARIPPTLAAATQRVLLEPVDADESMAVLEKLVRESEVRAQLAADPTLAQFDGQRIAGHMARYTELRAAKCALTGEASLHHWTQRQQHRLLVSTRSRLSGEGAELRRRLTMQGNRALRLRKVIEIGQGIADGDPIFDLRPIWMASPETVAQIFPREQLFDVVIFDEASQCRLEEALPVLTRGKRVVIAGDTKQLPPTRFFESAVVTSEDEEGATEQEWFEIQQGEVEDLLSAALNLEIEQCYLDVHYRSHNADLIQFSNQNFYGSRLQPVPGHPRNRAVLPPIRLEHVAGVYEERTNRVEALAVCRIVRDLLRRAEPPSIGIACFNTDQRDLIMECLDELAEQDGEFAANLATARTRKGEDSSEGLFVKNLENVQGDERDHMLISTTYGPDPNGKFYRRFGPLGRAGGGRRLNVLVTRARQEVHLVTSIPRAVYQGRPPLEPGQTPTGAWLLFEYLANAEALAALYAREQEELNERDANSQPARLRPQVSILSSSAPSEFAENVAHALRDNRQMRSVCYWGNDGFCIDVAIGHPVYVEDCTIGLQCDFNRYPRAASAVEWELFRREVLQSQGWQLLSVWSPQFFRNPSKVVEEVDDAVREYLAGDDAKNSIRVQQGGR